MKPRVLIVDDLRVSRMAMKVLLGDSFEVIEAESKQQCVDFLAANAVDVVLLDYFMPNVKECELLEAVLKQAPDVSILIVTASQSTDIIVQCIRRGAKDYVFKDDLEKQPELLKQTVFRLLEERKIKQAASILTDALSSFYHAFVPPSSVYQHIYDKALKAVRGELSTLILGETGVGKGTLVSYLHHMLCPSSPLVWVNCGSIPSSLAEAELFGYEKGAFTGADELKKGKLELAHTGILFLDEIGNLPLDIQKKLLHALESQSITRVGGHKNIPLQFRLILATNKQLQKAIESGEFLEDLYFRVSQFVVELPPIRNNPELIRGFISYFQSVFNQKYKTNLQFPEHYLQRLIQRPWKGNIRELKNHIQVMTCLYSQGEKPDFALDVIGVATQSLENSLSNTLDQIEKSKLELALSNNRGNLAKAARELGIHRSTLQGKLKKFDLYPSHKD